MSLKIARNGAPVLQGLGARALRAVAIAVLTVGLQVPVTAAAGGSSADATAVRTPIAAIAADPGAGSVELVPPQNDDGEDHFDEGDDEFDCDNVNEGEDSCVDDPEDRLDAGDDEYESGCANFDDGNDRCLDGVRQLDRPVATHATTVTKRDAATAAPTTTTDAAPAEATTLAGPDAALGVAALASAFALGAGSLWLLRRVHR